MGKAVQEQSPTGVGAANRFWEMLKPNGLAVVKALRQAFPSHLTTDELAEQSKVANKAIPPVMRHIRMVAARSGLSPDETIIKSNRFVDGGPVTYYSLSPEVAEEGKED